VFSGL